MRAIARGPFGLFWYCDAGIELICVTFWGAHGEGTGERPGAQENSEGDEGEDRQDFVEPRRRCACPLEGGGERAGREEAHARARAAASARACPAARTRFVAAALGCGGARCERCGRGAAERLDPPGAARRPG